MITPFNFPASIPAWKIFPALAYGNAVIWKPAPAAAGVAARLVEIVAAEVPPGVVGLTFGGPEVVATLIDEGADGVTFTGSTEAGLRLAAACAGRAVPVQCEMGGKNAAVVMAGADLDLAARACAQAAFAFAGQKCTSTSRLLIHTPIWDDFFERLEREVRGLAVGDPLDEVTVVGPVIGEAQLGRIAAATDDASEQLGAPLIHRPAGRRPGLFADLSVWGPVDRAHPLAQHELFGPVVAATPVRDLAEAIDANNAVPFGLCAAIFTRDLNESLRFARHAHAGTIRVNRMTTGLDHPVPFGGEGTSSYGPKELGVGARDFYTRTRSVWLGPSD